MCGLSSPQSNGDRCVGITSIQAPADAAWYAVEGVRRGLSRPTRFGISTIKPKFRSSLPSFRCVLPATRSALSASPLPTADCITRPSIWPGLIAGRSAKLHTRSTPRSTNGALDPDNAGPSTIATWSVYMGLAHDGMRPRSARSTGASSKKPSLAADGDKILLGPEGSATSDKGMNAEPSSTETEEMHDCGFAEMRCGNPCRRSQSHRPSRVACCRRPYPTDFPY